MKYQIQIGKYAKKFLDSQSQRTKQRLLRAIFKLPNGDVSMLHGKTNRYRLRVGDFRILFEKYDDALIILVVEIGNRGDVYK